MKTDEPSPCLVGVISLGCSKNRVNTEQMMYLLSNAGYSISGETDGSDIVLINTCGFIKSAITEAYDEIREIVRAKKAGKVGKIIVAGCLPERYKETIHEKLPEVDAFIGTGSFDDIVDIIKNSTKKSFKRTDGAINEIPRIISTSTKWAYLKIAEGCDNKCAYCCIPDIRGCFRSRPIEKIIEEAKKLADKGFCELIIVAQDTTMYGFDIYGERRLAALLEELNKIEKLKWIRLHYMYPDGFSDELIDVISKSDKILKYLDIPIQHINDDVLAKMCRRGSGEDIRKLFRKLRESIPGVVLRTSLIAGLPGEGEDEFNELCEFLQEFKIERVGIFPYSPEDGTKAALMERPDEETANKRAKKLMQLQSDIMQKWNESRIGTETEVLIEDMITEIDGTIYYPARSYAESPEIDGYILLKTNPCSIAPCIITGIINGELTGELTGELL